jgi:hypothetical protein
VLKVVLILLYIIGTLSDAYEKQRTSSRRSLEGCIYNWNSKRDIEVQKH